MYAGSSTIFNVPEITSLRRVKPLPKRRRTSAQGHPSSSIYLSTGPAVPVMPSPFSAAAAAVVASTGSLISDSDLEAAANVLLAPPSQPPPLAPQVQSLSTSLLPSSPTRPPSSSPQLHLQQLQSSPPLPPQTTTLGGANVNLDVTDNSLGGLGSIGGGHPHLPSDRHPCGDDATTAEELLAHVDTLSARMALQSYYMPMLGSVQEFLAAAAASAGISAGEIFKDRLAGTADAMGQYVNLESTVASAEFMYGAGTGYHGMNGLAGIGMGGFGMGTGVGMGMGMGIGRGEDDDGHGDGDYVDHLQQPGNTKKRKVPANVSVSQRDDADSDYMQDEGEERGVPFGRVVECDDSETSSAERGCSSGFGYQHTQYGYQQVPPRVSMVPTLYHGTRRGKLTAATLAGLQHKELLKTRKRQLAAVLGALSHGDTLALDQALSANYPFGNVKNASTGADPPTVKLSKRNAVRMARLTRMKEKENRLPNGKEQDKGRKRKPKFPACEFTFNCPSPTADRLIATKEEVAVLRNRFEAELARQAAETEQQHLMMNSKACSGGGLSRPPLAQKKASAPQLSSVVTTTATTTPVKGSTKGKKGRMKCAVAPGEQQLQQQPVNPKLEQQLPPSGTPTKSRNKKKKRSALANASNPHHLRNYVPSRLSQPLHSSSTTQQQQQQQQQQQSWISPPPVGFLSAEIPSRRKQKKNGEHVVQPTTQVPLTDPGDEWICPFCEYDLFYSDDSDKASFRKAVRNRKKILRRRRRARERAAAAASGTMKGMNGGNGENVHPEAVMQPGVPPAEHVAQQNGSAVMEEGLFNETSGPPLS